MKQIRSDKYKIICFTDKGQELMERLAKALFNELSDADDVPVLESVSSVADWARDNFESGNVLIFIGACGIAVRSIAPYIQDKKMDPAVLVMDEKGEFVIPILSGHLGGAVEAARKIALLTGARAVITTATDTRGEFAVDLFAKDNGLVITDMKKAKEFTARLLKSGNSSVYIEPEFEKYLEINEIQLPSNIRRTNIDEAELVITGRVYDKDALWLIPRNVVVGMGCKKGKTKDELEKALLTGLSDKQIDKRAVRAIVSADIKKEEPGLLELSKELGAEFITYDSDMLLAQEGDFCSSDFVKKITGVDNICERAVCAYGARLICEKKAMEGVTFAAGIVTTDRELEGL
ncbi:cobalt-precorrin 5A hydrolase [Butyrivibrio sp. INlla14]|uniref:cobalt-precorrin 5A hydrolase n=1 Tax=Butyrivibrio sp. INlla14 TaxID=1520808 RepID=UPI0008762A04|nr:cobalamin biosynthesis protein [Butyrivibrio sp. INlla14]SCY02521.1 cobalt-precorrin 5A hydrolase [Butyrivibrio sp. INlla14]